MPWDANLLVEEEAPESGWDPALLTEEPEPSESEQRRAQLLKQAQAVDELGGAIQAHRDESSEDQLSQSDLTPYQKLRGSGVGRKLFGPTSLEKQGMVAGGAPGLLDLPLAMSKFITAPPQVTEPIREASESVIKKIPSKKARGIVRGVRDTAIGIIGSLPAGGLMNPRAVMAPFTVEYVSSIPEQVEGIEEAAVNGDTEALTERATAFGLGAVATGYGGVHAAKSRPGSLSGGSVEMNRPAPGTLSNIDPSYMEPQARPISLGTPEIRVSPEVARRPPSGMSLVQEPGPALVPQEGGVKATPEMLDVLEADQLRKEILSRPPVVEEPQAPISLGAPEIRVSPEVARRPPSGMEMVPEDVPTPAPQEGGIKPTPEILQLIPHGEAQPVPINELLRSPVERGEALRQVEELGQQIRRREGFERARSEDVSEAQTKAEGTIFHPDKPLTENQLNIIQDSLRKAVLENQIPGESGIISGTALEKWADGVINTDFRGRTNLNPVDILAKQIPAMAIKGAAILERGIRSFAEWSKEMIAQYGEEIRPQLRHIYAQSLGLKGQNEKAPVPKGATPVPEAPPPVLKESLELTSKPRAELEKLHADAVKAAADAQADYRSKTGPEKMAAFEKWQELAQRPQAYAEALQFKTAGPKPPSSAEFEAKYPQGRDEVAYERFSEKPPLEATFNGIQMGGPSFKYFNEKTGRWNDVSAETAKTRGITISPEELAKADAATGKKPLTLKEIGEGKSKGGEAGFVDVQPIIDAVYAGAKKVGGLMRARGNLPPEAFAAKERAGGAIQATDKTIKYLSRDLMRALGKAYNLSGIERAAGGSRKIPVADVLAMDNYLKGDTAAGAALPADVRGALDNQRAAMTGLSERIISELQAQGGKEGLIDTIKNNLDVYVTRSYKFFDSKGPADKWYGDLPAIVRQRAESFVQQPRPDGTVPTLAEAQSQLLNWLSDLKDQSSQRASGSVGSKDLSQFMHRKTIAPEIRAVLGEYNDPMVNFARSMTKMTDWLANQEFLNEVKRVGEGKWLYPEDQAPPGFNVKIAAEGNEGLSPLDGMRTSPEIAQALREVRGRQSNPNAVAKTYLTINAITKQAATTQSILTQMRNLTSQPWFWGMNGHWALGELSPTLKAVAGDLGVGSAGRPGQWRAYVEDAAKHGIVGDTARASELREIIKDAALNDVNPAELTSFSLAKLAKKAYFKFPAEIYKISDELGKIYGWENEKHIVQAVHPNWTPEQVKTEAASRVRNQYPTYSKIPEALKQLRKVPVVGPFVSFPYEIMRTSYHAIGQSISEMRSANPVEQKIGAKRAASQVATLGAGFALTAVSKGIWDITDDQESDLRRFLPSWSKNSQLLFLGKGKGEVKFLNHSYQNPYSYLVDPVISVGSSIKSDQPFLDAAGRATAEFFRPFVSEQMLAAALIDVRRNETQRGGKVFNPQDDLGTKAAKVADHIAMTLTPGTVQRARRRIIPAFTDKQPEFGRQLNPGTEVAAELTGLRLENFNFKNGLAYKAGRFNKDLEDAELIFRKPVNRLNAKPAELLESFEEAQGARFRLWTELRKDYLAALRNGVDPVDAVKTLDTMNLPKKMATGVATGIYDPWVPSNEMISRIGDRMSIEQIQATYEKYLIKGMQEAPKK